MKKRYAIVVPESVGPLPVLLQDPNLTDRQQALVVLGGLIDQYPGDYFELVELRTVFTYNADHIQTGK